MLTENGWLFSGLFKFMGGVCVWVWGLFGECKPDTDGKIADDEDDE